MQTLAPKKTHCAKCGKNLQVIRKEYVIEHEDRAFCSTVCRDRAEALVSNRKPSLFRRS